MNIGDQVKTHKGDRGTIKDIIGHLAVVTLCEADLANCVETQHTWLRLSPGKHLVAWPGGGVAVALEDLTQ